MQPGCRKARKSERRYANCRMRPRALFRLARTRGGLPTAGPLASRFDAISPFSPRKEFRPEPQTIDRVQSRALIPRSGSSSPPFPFSNQGFASALSTMPGSFVDVGCRGARALAAGWWSRRRVLAGSEDLHPSLAVLALELARKAGAGAGAMGLREDLKCGAGPCLPT